jgi:hypothetical protein
VLSHTFHSQRSVWYPSYLYTSRTSASGDPLICGSGTEAVFGTTGLASALGNAAARGPRCVIVHSTTSSTKFVLRRIIKQFQQREDV